MAEQKDIEVFRNQPPVTELCMDLGHKNHNPNTQILEAEECLVETGQGRDCEEYGLLDCNTVCFRLQPDVSDERIAPIIKVEK